MAIPAACCPLPAVPRLLSAACCLLSADCSSWLECLLYTVCPERVSGMDAVVRVGSRFSIFDCRFSIFQLVQARSPAPRWARRQRSSAHSREPAFRADCSLPTTYFSFARYSTRFLCAVGPGWTFLSELVQERTRFFPVESTPKASLGVAPGLEGFSIADFRFFNGLLRIHAPPPSLLTAPCCLLPAVSCLPSAASCPRADLPRAGFPAMFSSPLTSQRQGGRRTLDVRSTQS